MLEAVKAIAINAGELVKEGFYGKIDVNYKAATDLVTQYDIAVEEDLKEKLSRIFPDHKIVAEESECDFLSKHSNVVYIDPIDGTTNFVHGFPFVSISIGVYTENVGEYGVVYNPILGELFHAEKGCGAYLNNHQINVSKTPTLEKSLIATGFPYQKENLPELMVMLEKTLRRTRGIRRAGSAALDLCYVAKGVFDLYYERQLKPWDISAGVIILEEAGGKVANLDGSVFDIYGGTLLSSNGILDQEFLELMKK